MVALAETLLGRGYELRVYDKSLNLSRLIGANEAEIQRRMPHLAQLLKPTAEEVVRDSDLIVASQKCVDVESLRGVVRGDQRVIDVNGWGRLEVTAVGILKDCAGECSLIPEAESVNQSDDAFKRGMGLSSSVRFSECRFQIHSA